MEHNILLCAYAAGIFYFRYGRTDKIYIFGQYDKPFLFCGHNSTVLCFDALLALDCEKNKTVGAYSRFRRYNDNIRAICLC